MLGIIPRIVFREVATIEIFPVHPFGQSPRSFTRRGAQC